ncbi:hypothetical protein SAMN05216368_1147 [Cryobacterium flavum]|nr:hypothetical protein SAMN05216368_1147 [Cryobacterium flavum]
MPTVEWIGGHQAWQPPPGWVPPVLGAVPAPAGWVFWSESEVGWPRFAHRLFFATKRSFWLWCAIFVSGVILTDWGATSGIGQYAVVWVAIGIGVIGTGVVGMGGAAIDLRKIRAGMIDLLRESAWEVQQSTERDDYQAYLQRFRGNQ